jgi:chromosome segregation ATPase
MSKAPTWAQFRKMLDELSKTNEKLHEQLHPLYEQVGEHKGELSREVEEWPQIEQGLLKVEEEMRIIRLNHLQSNLSGC